jgi:protocatechuate 3,4-dioxygenase beta subunit
MSNTPIKLIEAVWLKPLPRRHVLKGLGILAVTGPTSSALGCSSRSGAASAMLPSSVDPSLAGSMASTPLVAGAGSAAGSSADSGGGFASPAPQAGSQASAGSGAGHAAPAGASSSGAAGSAGQSGTAADSAGSTAGAGGSLAMHPNFDAAASCTLTTTDIEGPFFIDDHEIPNDESLIRSDVREGLPGCEFQLYFRLLDAKLKCMPIMGAELYIWHCNADGLYSGFDGQDPSKPYTGSPDPSPTNLDRFCRGVQTSDADGVASFITLYPGWYAGRPLHLHLVARMVGQTTRLITTQLYFPAAFTKEVHSSEPAYMARAASIPAGSLNPPTGNPCIPTLKHAPGLVVGTLNVIVDH